MGFAAKRVSSPVYRRSPGRMIARATREAANALPMNTAQTGPSMPFSHGNTTQNEDDDHEARQRTAARRVRQNRLRPRILSRPQAFSLLAPPSARLLQMVRLRRKVPLARLRERPLLLRLALPHDSRPLGGCLEHPLACPLATRRPCRCP